jgi:predicted CoA-substrate-specific enzyme activase
LGLDSGSTWTKGAAIDSAGRVLRLERTPSGWDLPGAAKLVLHRLRLALPPEAGPLPVVATGYGRARIPQAGRILTEISAHALGADLLRPGVRTVIDIGGQDTKAIAVEGSAAKEFAMNDKCAAGAGRFLEMVLARLELGLEALDEAEAEGEAEGGEPPVKLASVCAVFAESEIMSLLASGAKRQDVLAAAAVSLAERAAALASRLPPKAPAVLTGGLSQSPGFARRLGRALGLEVEPLGLGFYAGAVGAAAAALGPWARRG